MATYRYTEIAVNPQEVDLMQVDDPDVGTFAMYPFINGPTVKKIAKRVLTDRQYFAFSLKMRLDIKLKDLAIVLDITIQGADELLNRSYTNIRRYFDEYLIIKQCHPAFLCKNPLKSGE